MKFSEWLEEKYQEWRKSTVNKRGTYSAFGRYLDIRQSTFSQWINGSSEPGLENAKKLSEKLGTEIYDILGFENPAGSPLDVFPPAAKSALLEASEIIRTSGIKSDSPHCYRRAFAIAMLRSGVDVYTLARLMGHADIQTLRRYLKLVNEDLQQAHAKASPADFLK